MAIFAAILSYKGSCYAGWQLQKHSDAVANHVIKALSFVANDDISNMRCAGRTDSGVHALYQVISFSINTKRTASQLLLGANSRLPPDIRILWAKEMRYDFHARFDAKSREYTYIIENRPIASPLLFESCGYVAKPLDAERMNLATQCLLGEHDFQSFRSAECQSLSSERFIYHASVRRVGDFIYVHFIANAFLHRMVRNLVGSLVEIGLGHKEINWLEELLAVRDRSKSARTFSPAGLYLRYVAYAESLNFPPRPSDMLYFG